MFSGIVEGLEQARKIEKTNSSITLTLSVPKGWKLKKGESINIDGICSTIQKKTAGTFSIFYMAETLRRTNISKISKIHYYNLERSLRLNSLVGGHLVSGHIDTTGKVAQIKKQGESVILTVNIPSQFSKYIVYKGSICVNGVSLTVVSIEKNSFTVSLIPYTLKHTNLGQLKIGDIVNIEVDQIAKYLEKLTITK